MAPSVRTVPFLFRMDQRARGCVKRAIRQRNTSRQIPCVLSTGPIVSRAHQHDLRRCARTRRALWRFDRLGAAERYVGMGRTRVDAGGVKRPGPLHTAAAFDSASHRTFVFGGFHQDARTAQLWARTESAWTTVAIAGPELRAEHRGVYAPGIGFVVFGGIGGQGMSVAERGRAKLNDLLVFDGARWTRLDP